MAAESLVLSLGYRVPAVAGAHRILLEVAGAALEEGSEVFSRPPAERFRITRHQAEYFDPERPAEKTEADARWSIDQAKAAVDAVISALGQ